MGRTEKLGIEEIVDQIALELGLVPSDSFDNLRPDREFSVASVEAVKAGSPASSTQFNRIHGQLLSNDQRIIESLAGMTATFGIEPPQWWEPCDGKPFTGRGWAIEAKPKMAKSYIYLPPRLTEEPKDE